MQFYDFSKSNDIEAELERLYEWQFITETEYNAIERKKLQDFFNSNIFKRISNALTVEREMRFLTEVDAKKIAPHLNEELSKEKVIIQGAVDICFVEEDGVVVLDFKTDRVDNLEILKDTYGEQLNIYAMACEKIFGKKVKQKLIYSFNLSKEIEV
jgi:ATP-dependent helicase/nuclease subunit A